MKIDTEDLGGELFLLVLQDADGSLSTAGLERMDRPQQLCRYMQVVASLAECLRRELRPNGQFGDVKRLAGALVDEINRVADLQAARTVARGQA